MAPPASPNSKQSEAVEVVDQKAYWNGAVGERWAKEQAALDGGLRGYGEEALVAAAPIEGESVIDVGCGAGDTTLALAARVGSRGKVLGLDVSAPMLGRARERTAGLPNVTLALGDAADFALEAGAFDLLFSRFGVMFFPAPVAAFRHLATALRPGGRLAFVCWRTLAENEWAKVPLEAAIRIVGRPAPADPYAPGPFAFGEPGRVTKILTDAGFSSAAARKFDTRHRVGSSDVPTLEDAVQFSLKLGPAARLLTDADEATRNRASGAIGEALAPHMKPDGVHLGSATWIVTATK